MICDYRIEFDADEDVLFAYAVQHSNKLGESEKQTRSRVDQSTKDQGTPALHGLALATTVADDNPKQRGHPSDGGARRQLLVEQATATQIRTSALVDSGRTRLLSGR